VLQAAEGGYARSLGSQMPKAVNAEGLSRESAWVHSIARAGGTGMAGAAHHSCMAADRIEPAETNVAVA